MSSARDGIDGGCDYQLPGSTKRRGPQVLHVIPSLGTGGSERVVVTLARELGNLGIQSELCVLGPERPVPFNLAGVTRPVFLGCSTEYRNVAGFVQCVRKLRARVRESTPGVVHSHLWPAARAVGFATRGIRIPHVVHVQDTREWLRSPSVHGRTTRAVTRVALEGHTEFFIAVAEAVKRYTTVALPWIRKPFEVVHNGFDVAEFGSGLARQWSARDNSKERFVIGTAARLRPEKGQRYLLCAADALRRHGVPIKILIAGEGSERPRLEQLIKDLGLDDAVQLVGDVRDMPYFYRELDVFVLPSIATEGLPLTLLEAMAVGCPVVATNVAGASEAIRHGEDGLLVKPGDSLVLADALERVYGDPELRVSLRKSARARVAAEFSGQRMAAECVRIYQRFLGGV